MKTIWITAAAACLLGTTSVVAQSERVKLAVVNMELVMKAYPETKASRLILEQQLSEFETEQQEMIKELQALGEEFREARDQAANTVLSEEGRAKQRAIAEEKLRELRQRENEIKETAALRRKQLQDRENRMRRRIIKKLRDIVAEYCRKNDITLVLDAALPGASGPQAVVYSAAQLDITGDVLGLIETDTNAGE